LYDQIKEDEIRIYDLDENLIRKIRKEYAAVEVSEEFDVVSFSPSDVKRE